ncbi:MAG: two-component sensor histidine kinase [Oscillospiraceae bacterium]|nr:two-component sensor histidine kinase [Oscillospiraceae bacterium]
MITGIVSAVLLLIGLGGMLSSIIWIIHRGNSNRLTRLFLSCQVSIVLWLISELLNLFSESVRQYWISYCIGNVGISCFAPLWLMLSAAYTDSGKRLKKYWFCLPLIAVAAVCTVLTNPKHHLYYASFEAGGAGHVAYGPLFYAFQVIYYICILTGITMICVRHTRSSAQISKQSVLLILSAAIPLAINTLMLTGILHSTVALTPLFFALSSLLIIIALGRYGLLNINSIAIRDTISNIDSGVMIFDISGALTYSNKYISGLPFLKDVQDTEQFRAALAAASGEAPDADFTAAELKIGDEYYSLKRTLCQNRTGTKVANIVTISNVTEYHELAAAEKKLSLEQERNRIAQEMHDSAGHTFTMISSLARLMKYETGQAQPDLQKLTENLSEIDGLSRSGVTQLRCTINNLRDDTFMTSVTGAVQTVVSAVRGVQTDLCVQGEEDARFAFCIREMYDNCRETVTNALRYAEADCINIILKFLADRVEMYILDNGKGCSEIKEQNGLRGIRARTEAIGGTVKFSSAPGEGFRTVIRIPVKEAET